MKRVLIALAVCLFSLAAAVPALADDFSNGNGANAASNWKVYSLASSGQTYTTKGADAFADGVGFNFATTPETRLFMTTHPGVLLGDLTGKTITAHFEITGAAPAFIYNGGSGGAVRLYFQGNTNGSFDESKYWWSNPTSFTLAPTGGVDLTVAVDPALWSNFYGHFGTDRPDGFAAAAADVTGIGLSFGGGSFFANGVGDSTGTASFVLTSYSISS